MIFRVRAIPSCPGYFVSETGRVWGKRRKELRPSARGTPRRLWFNPQINGRPRQMPIHHAVAEAFLGPKPPGAYVCHHNDDRFDNRVENLYYGNASTNLRDAYRNGCRSAAGEHHPRAKFTWRQVRAIRKRHAAGGVTIAQSARDYGVSETAIRQIVHNRTWKVAK